MVIDPNWLEQLRSPCLWCLVIVYPKIYWHVIVSNWQSKLLTRSVETPQVTRVIRVWPSPKEDWLRTEELSESLWHMSYDFRKYCSIALGFEFI